MTRCSYTGRCVGRVSACLWQGDGVPSSSPRHLPFLFHLQTLQQKEARKFGKSCLRPPRVCGFSGACDTEAGGQLVVAQRGRLVACWRRSLPVGPWSPAVLLLIQGRAACSLLSPHLPGRCGVHPITCPDPCGHLPWGSLLPPRAPQSVPHLQPEDPLRTK